MTTITHIKTKQKLNKGGAIGGAEGGSVQEKEKGKEKEETINERKQSFRKSLSFYNKENPDKYPKQLFIDFEMYWTEHGPKDKKMKFEKQKGEQNWLVCLFYARVVLLVTQHGPQQTPIP